MKKSDNNNERRIVSRKINAFILQSNQRIESVMNKSNKKKRRIVGLLLLAAGLYFTGSPKNTYILQSNQRIESVNESFDFFNNISDEADLEIIEKMLSNRNQMDIMSNCEFVTNIAYEIKDFSGLYNALTTSIKKSDEAYRTEWMNPEDIADKTAAMKWDLLQITKDLDDISMRSLEEEKGSVTYYIPYDSKMHDNQYTRDKNNHTIIDLYKIKADAIDIVLKLMNEISNQYGYIHDIKTHRWEYYTDDSHRDLLDLESLRDMLDFVRDINSEFEIINDSNEHELDSKDIEEYRKIREKLIKAINAIILSDSPSELKTNIIYVLSLDCAFQDEDFLRGLTKTALNADKVVKKDDYESGKLRINRMLDALNETGNAISVSKQQGDNFQIEKELYDIILKADKANKTPLVEDSALVNSANRDMMERLQLISFIDDNRSELIIQSFGSKSNGRLIIKDEHSIKLHNKYINDYWDKTTGDYIKEIRLKELKTDLLNELMGVLLNCKNEIDPNSVIEICTSNGKKYHTWNDCWNEILSSSSIVGYGCLQEYLPIKLETDCEVLNDSDVLQYFSRLITSIFMMGGEDSLDISTPVLYTDILKLMVDNPKECEEINAYYKPKSKTIRSCNTDLTKRATLESGYRITIKSFPDSYDRNKANYNAAKVGLINDNVHNSEYSQSTDIQRVEEYKIRYDNKNGKKISGQQR